MVRMAIYNILATENRKEIKPEVTLRPPSSTQVRTQTQTTTHSCTQQGRTPGAQP